MTTIQVSILFPAVLLWLMLVVQYGLWWHAKQVADAAAAEAVAAARIPTGTAEDGDAAANRLLHQSGNLSEVTVVVNRDAGIVTVEVSGNAPRLVPGFEWTVTAHSHAPVERFIQEPDR